MGQLAMQPHYYKFWRELIKPKGFEVEKESLTPRYGKFQHSSTWSVASA